ncbi:MAG: glycosyltransferase [Armatimonadetes bacterium]|nr:glycosyltransferase [Armatimonadota bacterium]
MDTGQPPLRICVGVITRNRPEMFVMLLDSLRDMTGISKYEITFALVENNPRSTLSKVVEDFKRETQHSTTVYEVEERIGIPIARNRILRIAKRFDTDLVAFIDDDETVDRHWLQNFVTEMLDRDLDLVGGPVRLHPVEPGASATQRAIWRGLVRRNQRIERKASALQRAGRDDVVTIITSNWLCKREFLDDSGVRFDEGLGFSGGSDTSFYRSARARGARTGWVSGAVVHEFMPLSRLNARYQFCRTRDQAMASFHRKYKRITPTVVARSVGFFVVKAVAGVGLLLVAPLNGGRTLTAAIRSFGFAVGRVRAVFGQRSEHYKSTHGH